MFPKSKPAADEDTMRPRIRPRKGRGPPPGLGAKPDKLLEGGPANNRQPDTALSPSATTPPNASDPNASPNVKQGSPSAGQAAQPPQELVPVPGAAADALEDQDVTEDNFIYHLAEIAYVNHNLLRETDGATFRQVLDTDPPSERSNKRRMNVSLDCQLSDLLDSSFLCISYK